MSFPFLALPFDTQLEVFNWIGVEEVLNVSQTCKYLKKLCSNKYVWKSLVKRRWKKLEFKGEPLDLKK
jgi:hypothetical protein